MIGDFHFLRPAWLLAIVAAALLAWLIGRRSDVRSRWAASIAPGLLDHLMIDRRGGLRLRPVHLTVALLVLGALAAAGPTWERERAPFVDDKALLVIAIDLSQTMDATDIAPTRLERAKLKIRDLLALRQGARTSIFAYAGSAHMVLPLTDDSDLVQPYVDALATRIMPVAGKDTAKALEAAEASLADEDVPGTILFITDGVEAKSLAAVEADRGKDGIVVLGVGTEAGGPIKTGEGEFLTDQAGQRVLARFDVDGLKKLKSEAGIDVATVTADDADVRWIERRIRSHLEQRQADAETRWRDLGWWLTVPIALLSALWFRRGWTIRWASMLVAGAWLGLAPHHARAADWNAADPWLTRDQQGMRAVDRGDFAGAAALFEDPMWKGVALYRAGKFSEAIEAFAAVDTAESYFNQGDAQAHLGKPAEAAASYGQALKRRPDWPEAKANLAIITKLIAEKKKEDDEQQAQDPNQTPDQVQFDDKGEHGKEGTVDVAQQTAEMWMRNIQVSPADLLARKFAIETKGSGP